MLRLTIFLGCVLIAAVAAGVIILYNRKKTSFAPNTSYREPSLGLNNVTYASRNRSYERSPTTTENHENDVQNDDAKLVRIIDRRTGKVIMDRDAGINLIKPKTVNFKEDDDLEAETFEEEEQESMREENNSATTKQAASSNSNINGVIVLSVMADSEQPYVGYELLQALLSAGLRFGKMNIFHRHQQLTGNGPVLFSLASAAKPGTFELSKMGGYVCAGLTLFMQITSDKDVSMAFECMLDTAYQLVDDLGGEIWDDQRKPLTDDKIQHWRMQLSELERAKHTEDMFA